MRYWLYAVTFCMVMASSPSFAGNSILVKKNDEYVLVLSKTAARALKNYNPLFTNWKKKDYDIETYSFNSHQAPFAVIGDFNGDGIKDAGIDGHDDKQKISLVLLSNKIGFDVIELGKDNLPDTSKHKLWEYYYFAAPGKHEVDIGDNTPPIILTHDGFTLASEKGNTLYYYDTNEKSLRSEVTSD